MLTSFIEGLEEGLNDDQRTSFRTMFVSKKDVRTAIALAKFYDKTKELVAAYHTMEAVPSEHMAMLGKELADLEKELPNA